MSQPVIIFSYFNVRHFLQDYIGSQIHRNGVSYRSFAKQCGFSSPNYFQKLIREERQISLKTAKQITDGLDLDDTSSFYFHLLVKIENEKDSKRRDELIAQAHKFSRFSETEIVVDQAIRCHWLIGVLWELACCPSIRLTGELAQSRLGHIASKQYINDCLDMLVERGYLVKRGKIYSKAKSVSFSGVNDKRNFDVRKSHIRFLELAKLRIHDPLEEREFQGLNIAIPMKKFRKLQERVRESIHTINAEFSEDDEADTVVRVQVAAFQVTKKSS